MRTERLDRLEGKKLLAQQHAAIRNELSLLSLLFSDSTDLGLCRQAHDRGELVRSDHDEGKERSKEKNERKVGTSFFSRRRLNYQ